MNEQMSFLQAGLEPNQWLCPTCRGNRDTPRLLYPTERAEQGRDTRVGRCRVCQGSGWVTWDPEDFATIPY